jgi:hypothetical protein
MTVGAGRWQLNLADPLNDCVGADAYPQRDGQTRSSLAAHGKTDQSQRLVQSECSTCVWRGEGREALAEDILGAIHVATVKTPRLNLQPDGAPQPG